MIRRFERGTKLFFSQQAKIPQSKHNIRQIANKARLRAELVCSSSLFWSSGSLCLLVCVCVCMYERERKSTRTHVPFDVEIRPSPIVVYMHVCVCCAWFFVYIVVCRRIAALLMITKRYTVLTVDTHAHFFSILFAFLLMCFALARSYPTRAGRLFVLSFVLHLLSCARLFLSTHHNGVWQEVA